MKQVHPSYSFVASTKTITLTGLSIDQDQLLLIVNATRGVQYFNFADSSLRATVTPGANTTVVLTDASTTGHANGDALVIYYDDQVTSQVVSGTVTANPGTGAFTVSGTVGLDNASLVALENITVTVGAAISGSVTVNNFPASQTVQGTVTVANFPANQAVSGTVTANVDFAAVPNETCPPKAVLVGFDDGGDILRAGTADPLPVNVFNSISGTVTVGNSVTIGSLPAISGTVTANISGTVPVSGTFWQSTQPVSLASLPASTVTVSSLPAVSGTVTVSGVSSTVTARLVNPAGSTVTYAEVGTAGSPSIDVLSVQGVSGGTALPVQLPRVTLIDGSGAVTTANSAITVFGSSSTRSYLLVQVTTGSAFVNVGASATTVNGLSLTAGQGYAWENTIPQGVVSLISTVTNSRWVAKEA